MTSLITLDTDLQPVDWKAIDDACFDWVADLLGIDVIWEQQNTPQPGYPYISLLRNTEVDEGGADERRYRTIATDGTIMETGSVKTPSENEEVIYQPIQWTLSITAHVDFAAGSTDAACNAMALLGRVKRSLGLTATVDLLRAAGVSIVDVIGPNDVSVVVNGEWISKGNLDVILRTASVMTGRHGFIDKVELESVPLGVTPPVVVDAS